MGFKADFTTLETRLLTMEQILAVDSLKTFAEGGPDAPRAKLRMMKKELRKLQSPNGLVVIACAIRRGLKV